MSAWDPTAPGVVRWIEGALGPGARVVRVEPLPPSSTAKHLIELIRGDGPSVRLVLRRFHDVERLASDPWYVPRHEARALALLRDTTIPAPRTYAADVDATVCDVPALLQSWMPGEPAWQCDDLERYIVAAAEMLVRIHAVRVPAGAGIPSYAPYYDAVVAPSSSLRPALWRRVASALARPWPRHAPTFIHRDFHPGNVLWAGARVAGVVDWTTAAVGPAGIDLARMRQNLAAHVDEKAPDRFVAAYVRAGGDASAHQAYWDLLDAADSVPDLAPGTGPGGGDFGRFETYVERVLAAC